MRREDVRVVKVVSRSAFLEMLELQIEEEKEFWQIRKGQKISRTLKKYFEERKAA